MKTLQFKCTLLSDVVLSVSSASEGNHESLEFIPGGCFLGIVASELYKIEDAHTYELFHDGSVRFGDAHLLYNGIRSLRVPACLFHPKGQTLADEYYVYHAIEDFSPLKDKQLKQCRDSFYAFRDTLAVKLKCEKNYMLKSAYDKGLRRSRDEEMFGYESICKGQEFAFEVEIDNDNLESEIVSALCGIKHIGRSRSAQYGRVKIEPSCFDNPGSGSSLNGNVSVYADGRLVFYNEDGMSNLRPTAQDLGFGVGAYIDYSKSQLRTFRYSPRNYKRNAFDSERCGFEKGSVFVVEGATSLPSASYVGVYQNEGFGKIVCNPEFLAHIGNNGRSMLEFEQKKERSREPLAGNPAIQTPLIKRLVALKEASCNDTEVYEKVNDFVQEKAGCFAGDSFASQWGTIRGIAMSCKPDKLYDAIEDYLGHGIAADKWDESNRRTELFELLDVYKDNGEVLQNVVINLASQMAKCAKTK